MARPHSSSRPALCRPADLNVIVILAEAPCLSGQPERSAVLGEQGPPTAPCGAGGFLEGALSSRARNQGGPGSGDREEGMEGPRTLCSWAPGAERVGQRALRTAAEQAGGESRDTTQRYCKKRIEAERWDPTDQLWWNFIETLQPNAAGTCLMSI